MSPMRPHAASTETQKYLPTESKAQKAIIEPGYWGESSPYKRGFSGKSPSGWTTEKYPYLVEFDNYGNGIPGGKDAIGDPTSYCWGLDENGWYCNQPQWYREEFTKYVITTLDGYNENGHMSLQIHRGGFYNVHTGKSDSFFANSSKYYYKDGKNDEAWMIPLLKNR